MSDRKPSAAPTDDATRPDPLSAIIGFVHAGGVVVLHCTKCGAESTSPFSDDDRRLAFAFRVFKATTDRVRVGAEDPGKGCSVYNWRIAAVREIERLAAAVCGPGDFGPEPAPRSSPETRPSREEVERAVDALVESCYAKWKVGEAISAARSALLSLLGYETP